MKIDTIFTYNLESKKSFMNTTCKFLVLLLVVLCANFQKVHAQQIAGGEITYACKAPNQYEITFTVYAKCPSPSLSNSYTASYYSASSNDAALRVTLAKSGQDVTIKACENATSRCTSGSDLTNENSESIVKSVFKGTIKLPKQAKDWVVEVITSKRTSDLTSAKADNMYLRATINNTGTTCNTSSTFNTQPAFFSAEGSATTIDPGLANPDGDKLQVALISPMVTPKINLTYNDPFSATQPFGTSTPVSVNASNGKISFTPSVQGEKSAIAIQVKEFKNGVEVGSVMREMYTQTLAKKEALPFFNGNSVYTFCQGTPGSLSIDAFTDVVGAKLDITVTGATAAEFTVTPSTQKSTLKLNVTANSVGTRKITITVIDSKCGKSTKEITVKVVPKPIITNAVSDSIILCKKAFTFAINTLSGAAPYTYLWNNNTTERTLSASETGTYSVVVTDTNKCTASWSRKVTSPINFAFGQIRCVDDAISFTDISNIPGIATYNWTFGSVNVPNAGATTTHKFSVSGVYDVTMEIADITGCSNFITKKINIFPKTNIDFIATDTCELTEESDLKVKHTVTPNLPLDTTIAFKNIEYFVDGNFRKASSSITTKLDANMAKSYQVKLKATNDAGCVTEIEKRIVVRKKPTYEFYPKVAKYFYRCDNPSSIDTTFKFQIKSAPDLAILPMTLTVKRIGAYQDSIVKTYRSLDLINVPYKIVQNTVNGLTIKIKDTLGCTNDTAVVIQDPITPNLVLTKYYCFLNDNLKIVDTAFKKNEYHWGLDSLLWDLKDGSFATTKGFVDHVYTNKSIDEARITLFVRDKKNCVDTTSASKMRVFLSEPDTSQFQIGRSEYCLPDTVNIVGIKNVYINSWYYKFKDNPDKIFTTEDKWIPNKNFGKSVPDVDTTLPKFADKKYIASTAIVYNDSVAVNANTEKATDIKGCKLTVKRDWQVIGKLTYSLDSDYNHCKDSIKFFKALRPKPVAGLRLDTASWRWKLISPKNITIDQRDTMINNELAYNPPSRFFTDTATTQSAFRAQYPPYKLKAYYTYLSDNNTRCFDSTSLEVGNEVIISNLGDNAATCEFYRNEFYTNNSKMFLFSSDKIVWDYKNGITDTIIGAPGSTLYPTFGTYLIKALYVNQFGCTLTDTTSIVVKPSPKAMLVVDSVCFGVANRLDGSKTDPQQETNKYYWYYSDKETMPKLVSNSNIPDTSQADLINSDSVLLKSFDKTTNVMLAVQNSVGCFSYTDSAKAAKVNPVPDVDFDAIAVNTQDRDYLGNQPIAFDEQTTNLDSATKVVWTWDMGDGVRLVSDTSQKSFDFPYTYPYYAPPFPPSRNKYTVKLKVITQKGCIDSTSKMLDLNAYFVIPTAFSPNEDGLHDFLIGVGKGVREIKDFKIFNRWGEEIQSIKGIPTKDAENRGYLLWDGKFKGDPQPVGSYVYYAVVVTGNGDELIFKGNLALVK